jgi:hypothetical protein
MSKTPECSYASDQSVSGVIHYSYCSAPGEVAVGGNLYCAFHATGVEYEEQVRID